MKKHRIDRHPKVHHVKKINFCKKNFNGFGDLKRHMIIIMRNTVIISITRSHTPSRRLAANFKMIHLQLANLKNITIQFTSSVMFLTNTLFLINTTTIESEEELDKRNYLYTSKLKKGKFKFKFE